MSTESSGTVSWSLMTASQTSSALSRLSDVPKMESTQSTFKKNDAMTSERTVLPFWREIKKRMVRNLNFQPLSRLPTISSAWISAHSCHG